MPDGTSPSPAPSGHTRNRYQTLDAFLEKTHTALTNAQAAGIAPLLAARGYPAAVVADMLDQLAALRALAQKQQAEYGDQYASTRAYADAREAAHDDYKDHVALARLVFKNDVAARTSLGLDAGRARSQGGYVSQGLQFYNTALGNSAYRDRLLGKGISQAELTAGQTAFRNLLALTAAQQQEAGEAQAATAARDAAYDGLAAWMREFYDTARIALRKHPQLMEQIGLKDAS